MLISSSVLNLNLTLKVYSNILSLNLISNRKQTPGSIQVGNPTETCARSEMKVVRRTFQFFTMFLLFNLMFDRMSRKSGIAREALRQTVTLGKKPISKYTLFYTHIVLWSSSIHIFKSLIFVFLYCDIRFGLLQNKIKSMD